MNIKHLAAASVLLLLGAGCLSAKAEITSFEECAAAGNPVMESYPRQCRADGKTFVEDVAVPPEPPPEEAPAAEEAELRAGQTALLAGSLRVTLTAIEDSRCPKDVQCVWAGELAAALTVGLSAPGGADVEIRLGQTTKPTAEAYGFTIGLVSISEDAATISVRKL